MTNGAKIAIGCISAFVIMFIVTAVAVGVLSYQVSKPFVQMTQQMERVTALNTKYPFTEPTTTTALDHQRFGEFVVARTEIYDEVSEDPELKKTLDLMDPANQQPTANQPPPTMSDAFGMIGGIGGVMEVFMNNMDDNQMGPLEFAYYQKQMYWLVFHAALNGDAEFQVLWNSFESGTYYTQTNWSLPKDEIIFATIDFADMNDVDKQNAPTPEDLDLLDQHRVDILKHKDFHQIDAIFLNQY